MGAMSLDPMLVRDEEGDAPWNLVAYHIPWGPGYEGYEAGTLPGPDGTCIFLRSPTPLKRQRTAQACEKCRERKAKVSPRLPRRLVAVLNMQLLKCSGTRPTCGRCVDRGLACYYAVSSEPEASPGRSDYRGLTPSNSKEQLKTSVRNRLRRQSSHPEPQAIDMRRTLVPRRRSQSIESHVVPSSLDDPRTLPSMANPFQKDRETALQVSLFDPRNSFAGSSQSSGSPGKLNIYEDRSLSEGYHSIADIDAPGPDAGRDILCIGGYISPRTISLSLKS